MRQPRFDVYEDAAGEWRWRLLAANGRTIADSGEGYTRMADAARAVSVTTQTVEHIGHKAMIARLRMSAKDGATVETRTFEQIARATALRTRRDATRAS